MDRFSVEAFDKERLRVVPDANGIIRAYAQKPMQDMSPAVLQKLTDATTLWVPGGDHSWKDAASIVEARYFAHELTKFPRASGEPECTHGIGAADLIFNVFPVRNANPLLMAFVLYNHDRIENNRGYVTVEDIFDIAWLGDPYWKPKGVHYLNQLTDTPGLHGTDRLKEQVLRANEDKSGVIATARLVEKLNANFQDAHNLAYGIVPFNDLEKYARYAKLRIEMAKEIKSPDVKDLRKLFIKTAEENLKKVRRNTEIPSVWWGPFRSKRLMARTSWPNSYLVATPG